ncbi:MAG TPA: polysaccharide biosynthesis tyrosine autokinase [Chitinophagaceae bacterium]|nr:polysaccharide biosynthesis tyrosine autokinase [Chitinophagaceae bacterium]
MAEDKFFKQQVDNNNVFLQLLQRYLPFWPLFVITTSISLAVTFVYLRSQVRIYVASAKVLLKDPNKGSNDSKLLEALNVFGDKKIVENEIVVLKSSDLMQQVVRDLDLYCIVYNQGKVRVEELYKNDAPVWFKTARPETVAPGKFFFSIDWNRQVLTIDNKTVHFNQPVVLNNTVYNLVINKEYPKYVTGKNFFVQFNSVPATAAGLIGNLQANPISNQSTVIDMRMETPKPQKGIEVLTSLFTLYNQRGIEDKNQTAARTLAFIDDRLGIVTSQLDSTEKSVENYKTRNQVVDLSAQAQVYLDKVRDIDRSRSEIAIQLDVLNDVNRYVNSKRENSGTVPSLALLNDPTLANLLTKLHESEAQLAKAKSISGEKSEAVIFGEQQVTQYRSEIRDNLGSIRRNLLSAQGNFNSSLGASTGMLRQIPQKERGLIDVTRQQSIKNNIYTFLLQKREETALNYASTVADLRVIETADSYGPIKPVAKNYYIAGLALGILLAAFIVLIREQFNRKILFRSEIEEKTKVPVVGEIVQIASKDPIVILEGKRTIIAEQFRSLRTNLSFMALNEDAKTTLITSNVSGEGKSFVSINLAISNTLTDKKVALLELDLRKPRLSALLGVNRDPGISNYLVGKIPIEGIIKETKIKNLFVISAGAIPPNPSELILSNKFKELMVELKSRFDYLIIDSAPIGPVSDSLLLKDYADTTIFVVRHNVTPKVYLKQIESLYQLKKFNNMCIVFNGLKRRGIGGSYGYGNYGYGYGYGGYGYGESGQGYYVTENKKKGLSGLKNFFRK